MVAASSAVSTKAVASLDDVLALESRPYREVLPFTTIGEVVDRFPAFGDRVAISFMPNGQPEEPTEDVSYRSLHRKVMQVANGLRRLGVDADESVAFVLPNVPEALITLMAAALVGRSCPINYMLSAAAIAEIMTAAKAKVLVVFGPDQDLDIWSKVAAIRELVPSLQHVVVVGAKPIAGDDASFENFYTMPAEPEFDRTIDPDAVCSIYHTGGSTGSPKLVQHTHANQVHCLWLVVLFFDFGPDDVILNGHPLFHVAGALNYGIAPLAVGSRLLMPSKLGLRNRTFQANVWRVVERHKVSVTIGGPTVITMLLNLDARRFDISSMRLHASGGSSLPIELVNAMSSKLGIPVRNAWGMTETAGLTTLEAVRSPVQGTCGWRLPFTEVAAFAMSPDGEMPSSVKCRPGEVGMLAVKGPHVTPGYMDTGQNAKSFTSDGWFITGDLGRIDPDGSTYLTGRAKDVIIRGGHNIDPLAIEQTLLQHPAIALCAAVGQPDSYSGEIPVAFVQLAAGSTFDLDAVLKELAPAFVEPAAIPKRLYRVDGFPMTSTGKIFKPALRQRATEAAVAEKLAAIGVSRSESTLSFVEREKQEVLRVTLAPGTSSDTMQKAQAAVASLRVRCEVVCA